MKCHARFVAIGNRTAEDNLARHVEAKHAPKPFKNDMAAGVEHICATVTGRIASGELKPGQTIVLIQLVDQLGTTRHRVQAAVDALVKQGVLGYSGAGATRRVIVVAS
jgi:DNA-binding GntR family transcriptional regulator